MLIKTIRKDLIANRNSGLLTNFFLVNYRIGRLLYLSKLKNKVLYPLYALTVINSRVLSAIFGCSVPFSSNIGNNVEFRHGLYGVFISGHAVIGENCKILHHVTIGSNYNSIGKTGAPIVHDGVFIGAGCKIIGPISIGRNCRIGANCLIVKSMEDGKTAYAPMAFIK